MQNSNRKSNKRPIVKYLIAVFVLFLTIPFITKAETTYKGSEEELNNIIDINNTGRGLQNYQQLNMMEGTCTVKDEYATYNNYSTIYSGYWHDIVFEATSTYDVGGIGIYGKKIGTGMGNLNCGIYALDGYYKPTGSAIINGTIAEENINTEDGWIYINFSTNEELTIYTKYGIVCKTDTGSGSNYIKIYGNWNYGTHWGFSENNGSTWSMYTDATLTFQTCEGTTTPEEYCGDGTCNNGETFENCPEDCNDTTPENTASMSDTIANGMNMNFMFLIFGDIIIFLSSFYIVKKS